MSNYYTQGTTSNQPSALNYSTWGQESSIPAVTAPVLPEPPIRVADPNATRLSREHFRTAADNAIRVTAGPSPAPPALPTAPETAKEETASDKYDWLKILGIVAAAIVVCIGIVLLAKRLTSTDSTALAHQSPPSGAPTTAAAAAAFGSGLSAPAGILNDLEFL